MSKDAKDIISEAQHKLSVIVCIIVDSTTYDDDRKEQIYDEIMENVAFDFDRTCDVIDKVTTLLTEESNDNVRKYHESGVRLTDCCGAFSTYHIDEIGHEILCCKKCWNEVPVGQGDGLERNTDNE